MYEIRAFPANGIYHVFNKSIANFQIFKNSCSIVRFLQTVSYYNAISLHYSLFVALRKKVRLLPPLYNDNTRALYILAYCIMPDHYHLLIKIIKENTLSKYMNDIENSYTRYFNKKNSRKGPLWQSHFCVAPIKDDSTLLHVSRYIHLNPSTSGLVQNPIDWQWSSYNEYLSEHTPLHTYKEFSIKSASLYKKFVEDQIDYQRAIKRIRRSILE